MTEPEFEAIKLDHVSNQRGVSVKIGIFDPEAWLEIRTPHGTTYIQLDRASLDKIYAQGCEALDWIEAARLRRAEEDVPAGSYIDGATGHREIDRRFS
jgi:hypothetical protein